MHSIRGRGRISPVTSPGTMPQETFCYSIPLKARGKNYLGKNEYAINGRKGKKLSPYSPVALWGFRTPPPLPARLAGMDPEKILYYVLNQKKGGGVVVTGPVEVNFEKVPVKRRGYSKAIISVRVRVSETDGLEKKSQNGLGEEGEGGHAGSREGNCSVH